ncbi:DNA-binding transcriptional regulator, GntR family [Evansella caseinilytica]|uniref:DNA-binding transcriptional regulator, GntR family n=1 Tax=Evansella caseinilytica TaxID=1503961 RepID=A0A1H3HUP6_9BACI|nr:GntR family transcriptional regulator [Evansella caseinilytica]SDY19217.1 DNA-binding transcriptional regulator, GntR family [Evansella caseinilytica]
MNITIQEQTFERLRRMIIKTELTPGQKISEARLTEMLNVGRTPVRESLKQLKKQGLVYTIPQSGTYVSKIDMEQAVNARFVRECVEKEVMTELSAKLTKSSEETLANILRKQKLAFAENDIAKYYDLDNDFHRTCYAAVGKFQVWDWINQFNIHLDRFRWLHLKVETFDFNTIAKEHEDLFEAVRARDTVEVKYLTVRHIHFMLRSQKRIIAEFPDYFTDESNATVKK